MPCCSCTTRSPGWSWTRSTALRRRAGILAPSPIAEQRQPDRGEGEPGLQVALGDVGQPGVRRAGDVRDQSHAEVGLGELVGRALGGAGPGERDDDPPALPGPGTDLLDGPRKVAGEAVDGRGLEGDLLVVVLGPESEGTGGPPGQPTDPGGGLDLGQVPERGGAEVDG